MLVPHLGSGTVETRTAMARSRRSQRRGGSVRSTAAHARFRDNFHARRSTPPTSRPPLRQALSSRICGANFT